MRHFYLSIFLTILSANFIMAQNNSVLNTIKNHLDAQAMKLGLNATDYADLSLQTNYTNQKTNVEYAYVQQNIGGYPVYNAIGNFALQNGNVVYMTETFQKNA